MKASKKYLLCLAFSLLAMIGCDVVNVDPESEFSKESFFKTLEDAQATRIGLYANLVKDVERFWIHGEARADMLERQTTGDLGDLPDQLLTDNNSYANWQIFYRFINVANSAIKYVPDIAAATPAFTAEESLALVNEARFVRATGYFYLVRLWGEVPLVLHPAEDATADYSLAKATQEEILQAIIADLEAAAATAKVVRVGNDEVNKGMMTRGAVYATLADVYLWMGLYQKAIDAANMVNEFGTYNLVNAANWENIFFKGNSTESIFEFQYDNALGVQNRLRRSMNFGQYFYRPSPNAVSKWDQENDLVRGHGVSWLGEGAQLRTGQLRVWKFAGKNRTTIRDGGQQSSDDAHWILYRLPDVMLMKAEALNRLADTPEMKRQAMAIVNAIRARVNLGPSSVTETASQLAVEDAIMHERTLELAYEGKRWFDLVRLSRRGRHQYLVDRIVENSPVLSANMRKARIEDPRSIYWPIFRSELENNRKLEQNPFYK